MKHCLIALSSLLVAASSFGQATFQLNNRIVGVVDAPVFVGDSSTRANADYVVALFGGAAGTAEAALTQQGATLPFRSTPATGLGYANTTGADTTRSIGGTADGASSAVQLRAWKASMSYADANAAGLVGKSAVLTLNGGGGLTPPAALAGLASFTIPVPEPSAAALGLLGAGLLAIRRKK